MDKRYIAFRRVGRPLTFALKFLISGGQVAKWLPSSKINLATTKTPSWAKQSRIGCQVAKFPARGVPRKTWQPGNHPHKTPSRTNKNRLPSFENGGLKLGNLATFIPGTDLGGQP